MSRQQESTSGTLFTLLSGALLGAAGVGWWLLTEAERRQRHEIGVVPRHSLVMLPHGFIPLPGCCSGKAAPGRPHLKDPVGMMTAG